VERGKGGTKIKSATGNNGDYSKTNRDINFSRSIGDTLKSAANNVRDVKLLTLMGDERQSSTDALLGVGT